MKRSLILGGVAVTARGHRARGNVYMTNIRAVLLAAVLLFVPAAAYALGFGGIKLNSALNEPLDAEIDLLSATSADVNGLEVGLASRDTFLRAGIEFPQLLTKLKFLVQTRADGSPYIKISSHQPIREPFLNFLLDMRWKNGRIMREYTVLLDPPHLFRQQQPAVVETPQTEPPQAIARTEPEVVSVVPAPVPVPIPVPAQESAPGPVQDAQPEPAPVPVAEAIPEPGPVSSSEPLPSEIAPRLELPLEAPAQQQIDQAALPEPAMEAMPVPIPEVAEEPKTLPVPEAVEPAREVASVEPLDNELYPRISLDGSDAAGTEQVSQVYSGELDYGITRKNDNLWTIGEKLRAGNDSVTIYQVMMAVLNSNPEAFVDNNVHKLKVGYVLRIEDPSLIHAMDKRQAASAYQEQTLDWEQYKQSVAADTTVQAEMSAMIDTSDMSGVFPEQSSGELTITAPDSEVGLVAQGMDAVDSDQTSPDLSALRNDLRQAIAEASAERGRNVELNNRLRELEAELNEMQRMLSLRDNDLAILQEQLRELNQTPVEPKAPTAELAPQPAAELVPQPVAADKPMMSVPEIETQTVPEVTPIQPEVQQAPQVPEQVVVTPKVTEDPLEGGEGLVDVILGALTDVKNLLVGVLGALFAGSMLTLLIIVAAVLVLGILIIFMIRQRNRSDSDFQESILAETDVADMIEKTAAVDSSETSEESSFLSDFAISGMNAIEAEDTEVDPLTEADVFMAYGRYEAAEERLTEAIGNEPQRKELKLKLIELYYTSKNKSSFEAAAEDFYAGLGGQADADPMWEKVVTMGAELLPDNPLFSGGGASAQAMDSVAGDTAAEGVTKPDIMDIGLDTGVFKADDFAPTGDEKSAADEGAAIETMAMDAGAGEVESTDFDFDLDEPSVTDEPEMYASEPPASEADSSRLDFDLDLDAETGAETGTKTQETDLPSLDFDLDLEGENATQEEEAHADLGDLEFEPEPVMESKEEVFELGLTDSDSGESQQTMEVNTSGLDFDMKDDAVAELDATDAAELDMVAGMDEVGTKLDLAKAYIDMGDPEGARSILDEVMDEGNATQKQEAEELLQQMA